MSPQQLLPQLPHPLPPQPQLQNNKVASLAVGTAVTVYELTEVNGAQWARIKWNGNEGWVAKQYVNLTGGIGGTGSSNTANGTYRTSVALRGLPAD